MSYVKVTNGSVDQYPYTVGQLRRDNPNTSFPKRITEDTLNSFGVYSVVKNSTPSFDAKTQNLSRETTPTYNGTSWVIGWTVVNKTTEEQETYNNEVAELNRSSRDHRLAETDWWALPDSPTMTTEQTTYRQALRDITSHANWPHLEDADWPTKP